MNKPTPKPLLFAAFAAIVAGAAVTLVVVGILLYPKQNTVSADSSGPGVPAATPLPAPDDWALPTPPPLPTFSPLPTVSPVAAVTAVRSVAIPVVAAVAPVQPADTGLPIICQSQSYTPEREAQCPHSAPIRSVAPADLGAPAAPASPVPPVASPTPTPAPPAPLAPAATATVTPSPAPTPSPTPSPSATPASRDCGGYPALLCNAARDSLVDPWGMYNRECVSYAAYKVSLRRPMPNWGGHGNAFQWPDNARALGIPVDGSPRVGDVAILTTGFGHAMYVEAVTGSYITVSQYNYDDTGEFSRMVVPSAGLVFIHF